MIDLNKKNILITGGAGFIGSNLAIEIQSKFPKSNIVIFDCFRNERQFSNGNLMSLGHFENLIHFNGEIICGNINSIDDLDLLKKFKFDYIFHQAAISDTRVTDQEAIFKTNVNSFYNILYMAKSMNSVLVYASSAATYGNSRSPQKIGSEAPNNPYGFSKNAMDKIAMKFIHDNPDQIIIGLRYFNVYGPGEFYKNTTASTILQFALQILSNHPPKLFKRSDKIFRDFVYIKDVIMANLLACNSRKSGIYNVGTGIPRSFQDIADILLKELNSSFKCKYITNPYKNNYQFHTQADLSNIKKNLSYIPRWSLEDGIKDYIPEIIKIDNKLNS